VREHVLERDDHDLEDAREHRGEDAVDQRHVDYQVYVVEAVPEDGHSQGHGQARQADHGCDEADLPTQPPHAHGVGDHPRDEGAQGKHRGGVGEPLDLLPLHAPGPAQPRHQGAHGRQGQGGNYGLDRTGEVGGALDAQEIADGRQRVDRSGRVGRGGAPHDDRRRDEPGEGPPTGRRQPAVGEKQTQEREEA
jgi:hypothetical protein